ncbi:MAG: recombination mediator protein UvsY [Candidatus Izemoplasma sp.]
MNKLQQMIKEDLEFKLLDAHLKLIQCPSLRVKYSSLLMKIQKKVDDKELDLKSLYSTKWRHYSMDHDQDVDRRDLPVYIEGDDAYIEMKRELNILNNQAKEIDHALKAIDNLNWQIPAAIKFYMFQQGA